MDEIDHDLIGKVLDLLKTNEFNLEQIYIKTNSENLSKLGQVVWYLISNSLINIRWCVYIGKIKYYFKDTMEIPNKIENFTIYPDDIEILFSRT